MMVLIVMMDLEKYIKEVINMEFSQWLIFGYGIILGWWLPIMGRLLFVELPVQLKLSKEAIYNERKPYGKK